MARFEGRLFAKGGSLFLVVAADQKADTARVSCQLDGQRMVLEMSLTEVSRLVAESASLNLDNLNGPDTTRRVEERQDGWYFTSREGAKGPYGSAEDARRALGHYVLAAQTETPSQPAREPRRPPGRSAQRRRISDVGGAGALGMQAM